MANAGALASVDEGRVRIVGPTSLVRSITPGTTLTIDGLLPGTYGVALEGLTAGQVETYGETVNVSVSAGRNTSVTVTLNSFVPGFLTVPSSGLTNQTVDVQFGAVTGAENYRVEWGTSPAFTTFRSLETSATNATITVDATGTNFVRVRALNKFGSVGRATANRTIDVLDPPPVIAVTPGALDFSGEAGGPDPQPQTLSISNTGGGTLDWTVTDDASWLSVSPASGTQSGTVMVTVNTAGLTEGPLDATITVIGNAANAPLAIPVHLTLTKVVVGNPVIGVSPAALNFPAQPQGANPPVQNLSIRNDGAGTLNWNVTDDASWLTLSPTSGTNTGTVNATVNAAGLQVGTHSGQITITANATNSPVTVPFSFTVTQSQTGVFQYTCGPVPIPFQAVAGGANPAAKSCSFSNTGGTALSWSATDNASWLTLSPTGGSIAAGASANVSLNVNTGGLAAGTYTATFTVTGNAANLPVTVAVVLTVAPASPTIVLTPTSVSFTATGGTNPASKTVSVTNGGGGTLTGLAPSVSYTSGQPAGWLGTSLNQTTAPATLTLSPTAGGLPSGTYSATVSVASPVAANSPQSVSVTFTVTSGSNPSIVLSQTSVSRQLWDKLFYFDQPTQTFTSASDIVNVTNGGSGTLSGLTGTLTLNGCTTSTNWIGASLGAATAPTSINLTWATPTAATSCTANATGKYRVDSSLPGVASDSVLINLTVRSSSQPITQTTTVSNIGQTSATVQGTTDGQLHYVWFLVSTDSLDANNAGLNRKPVIPYEPQPPAYGQHSWSLPVTGLAPGTKYFYQIMAEVPNKGPLGRGGVKSFTTSN